MPQKTLSQMNSMSQNLTIYLSTALVAVFMTACGPKTPPKALVITRLSSAAANQGLQLKDCTFSPRQEKAAPGEPTSFAYRANFVTTEAHWRIVQAPGALAHAVELNANAANLLSRVNDNRSRGLPPRPKDLSGITWISRVDSPGTSVEVAGDFVAGELNDTWDVDIGNFNYRPSGLKLEQISPGGVSGNVCDVATPDASIKPEDYEKYYQAVTEAAKLSEADYQAAQDKIGKTALLLRGTIRVTYKGVPHFEAKVLIEVAGKDATLRNDGGWDVGRHGSATLSIDYKSLDKHLIYTTEADEFIENGGPILDMNTGVALDLKSTGKTWTASQAAGTVGTFQELDESEAAKAKAELLDAQNEVLKKFQPGMAYLGISRDDAGYSGREVHEIAWEATSLQGNKLLISKYRLANMAAPETINAAITTHAYLAEHVVLTFPGKNWKGFYFKNGDLAGEIYPNSFHLKPITAAEWSQKKQEFADFKAHLEAAVMELATKRTVFQGYARSFMNNSQHSVTFLFGKQTRGFAAVLSDDTSGGLHRKFIVSFDYDEDKNRNAPIVFTPVGEVKGTEARKCSPVDYLSGTCRARIEQDGTLTMSMDNVNVESTFSLAPVSALTPTGDATQK
jgi:hypothetical protein